MIVRVSVDNAPANQLFDYKVPDELSGDISIGSRVTIPFAKRASASGIVVELPESSPFEGKLKSISALDSPSPTVLPSLVKLAIWMSKYYLATLSKSLETLLPAPVRNGRIHEKTMLYIDAAESFDETTLTKRQGELLADIRRVGGGWMRQLCEEFQCTATTLRKMADLGALVISERQQRRSPLRRGRIVPTKPLPLNNDQAIALSDITNALPSDADSFPQAPPKPILLFGVTGSGKTEVYLQAISNALERGLGAIVLVPEISLTPQTVMRFSSRFGDRIAVLHSALSNGERYDEWQRIRKGDARVVVGPRSAVFAPVEKLGLIVVDEEHEPSYKQEESPRYNARDVAVMRAHFEKCVVVLGSATPSMESWRNSSLGKYALSRLSARAAEGAAMPLVRVIDMNEENARSGRVNIFAKELLDAMHDRLQRHEQIILFLNRRGFSTSLTCPSCGYVETCERCDVPFTYHRADDCLRCHICGAWKRPPSACPSCSDAQFKFAGFGTQRVESIVKQCFPSARVARMDADSTSRKLSHDDILDAFKAGETDILIGTQMIAKGLHFPLVTLVGIINADSSLHIPDFRAGERTFQLLAQVSGRTGRGTLPGEVYVQSYTPEHPAVQMAKTENFEGFAKQELPLRSEMGYPPFVHLTCITLTGPAENLTESLMSKIRKTIIDKKPHGVVVSEVCPASLPKADNLFRFQVVLRGPNSLQMTEAIKSTLEEHPISTPFRISVDVDAHSF